jgi:hypothetical protein
MELSVGKVPTLNEDAYGRVALSTIESLVDRCAKLSEGTVIQKFDAYELPSKARKQKEP